MEDKFEHQIADQVSGFQLTPNAQVWKGVALELDKEKSKKRGIFWWMPLGLLVVGLTGWFLFTSTEAPLIPNSELPQKNAKKELPNHSIPFKDSIAIVNQISPSKEPVEKANSNSLIPTPTQKGSAQMVHNKTTQPNLPIQVSKEITEKQNTAVEQSSIALLVQQSQQTQQQQQQQTQSSSTFTIGIDSSQAFNEVGSNVKKNEVIIQETKTKKDSNISSLTTTSILTKKPTKASWRFQVAVGSTRLSEFSIFGNNVAADLAFANNSSAIVAGFPNTTSIEASKQGFHAEMGASKQWQFSKRWELSAGLLYRYLQNQQMTGLKKDSSYLVSSQSSSNNKAITVNGYYLAGSQNSLINRAHWLMIPIQIHFNLNPSSKLNWLLYGGTNLSWNFANNWLLPDQANNIMYESRPLTNIIGIHAQLGIELRNQKSQSLSLGWEKSMNSMSKLNQSKQYWNQLQVQYSQPIYLKKSYKK
ncbi:MAG: hypothetical protein CFE25_17940 [Chitinophagaceae bacterium BSSC1]|nr:MAG: hypothetical protein CFE25_17940 [Chitinophagaceae bacterium BSSC1]